MPHSPSLEVSVPRYHLHILEGNEPKLKCPEAEEVYLTWMVAEAD